MLGHARIEFMRPKGHHTRANPTYDVEGLSYAR